MGVAIPQGIAFNEIYFSKQKKSLMEINQRLQE